MHICYKIGCRRPLRIRVQLFSNTRDASAGEKSSVAKDGDLDGEVSVPLTDVISQPYYRESRAILDCGYHSNYSLTSQNLKSTVTDMVSGVTCLTTELWFTASCMGAGKSYTIGSLMKYSAKSAAAVGRPPACSVALTCSC